MTYIRGIGGCDWKVHYRSVVRLYDAVTTLMMCHRHHFVVLQDDMAIVVSATGLRCLGELNMLGDDETWFNLNDPE